MVSKEKQQTRGAADMQQKAYEIWRHEKNRTWKVFTNVSEDSRQTLVATGWKPVIEHIEKMDSLKQVCPEEVLRRVSRSSTKVK